MTFARLDLSKLPRVSAASAALHRAAGTRLGPRDRKLEQTVPPFGTISWTCLTVGDVPPLEPTDGVWTLVGPDHQGRIVLDGWSTARLLALGLGLAPPNVVRPIGSAERGVVAAVIARVLHSVGAAVTVSLRRPPPHVDGLVRLTVMARSTSFSARVGLDVPPRWIPIRQTSDIVAQAASRAVPVPVAVELATTSLAAAAVLRARAGDAVVFDVPALSRAVRWPVQVRAGDHAFSAELASNGELTVVQTFYPVRKGATQMNDDDRVMSTAATVIASAPIEVTARIGRFFLRADELLGMAEGTVLPLGSLRSNLVEVTIGSRLWARGELVDVEGQLGVRLTELRDMDITDAEAGSSRAT